jgi:serine protease Do
MTAAFAYGLGMTEIYGAIFKQPERGGPAAMAGIEAGDVVTAINGSPLSNWRDFAPTISMMAPGTTVYLNTRRDGQWIMASVTLGSSNCPGNAANARQRHATRS